MGDLDGIVWYIDPVAACLLGILLVALAALVYSQTLNVRIVRPGDVPWCDLCECYHHESSPHIGESLTRESHSATVAVDRRTR